jgi:uncharacterized protein (DUF433 family)
MGLLDSRWEATVWNGWKVQCGPTLVASCTSKAAAEHIVDLHNEMLEALAAPPQPCPQPSAPDARPDDARCPPEIPKAAIVATPGTIGGRPRIGGTRLAFGAALWAMENVRRTDAETAKDYGITSEQVELVRACFEDGIRARHNDDEPPSAPEDVGRTWAVKCGDLWLGDLAWVAHRCYARPFSSRGEARDTCRRLLTKKYFDTDRLPRVVSLVFRRKVQP